MIYPANLEKLIEVFEMLPGVGIKTAQRYAFAVMNYSEADLDKYITALEGLKKIGTCPICGFLAEDGVCPLCEDKTRDNSTIMVVAYPQEVAALEKTAVYHGAYHVLGGLISSSKGIFPEDLNINSLLNRLSGCKELILATSSTMDGEMTALYLDKILKDKNIKVTRLAHGLPMGASLDYTDELTLAKALTNRQQL